MAVINPVSPILEPIVTSRESDRRKISELFYQRPVFVKVNQLSSHSFYEVNFSR